MHGAGAGPWSAGKPIGLQLYTVREAAAKDLPGTLKAIAEIGYREVELAGGPPADRSRRCAGSSPTRTHLPEHPLQHGGAADSAEQKIEFARALGAQYLVCSFPWTADSRFRERLRQVAAEMTLDDWKWNAEQLNRIGELARKAGVRMRLSQSQHGVSLVRRRRRLRRAAAPDGSGARHDRAGHRLGRHGRRRPGALSAEACAIASQLLHVKEVRKDLQGHAREAPGADHGSRQRQDRLEALFAAMDPEHIRHYFVEQENFERPPLEAVKISFEYLSKSRRTSDF